MIDGKIENKVHSFPILNVKVFLIETDQGCQMVDSGIPYLENKINRAFLSCDVDPRDVSHILLTHGHLDHIGCLAYARKITGAKVICHKSFAENLVLGKYETAIPRIYYWKLLNSPISWILGSGLEPVIPDIVFEDELILDDFEIPGKIVHSPGHSPGSCSIILENGEILIGDLIREKKPGVIDTGLFYNEQEQIFESLRKISTYNPIIFYLSHGRL